MTYKVSSGMLSLYLPLTVPLLKWPDNVCSGMLTLYSFVLCTIKEWLFHCKTVAEMVVAVDLIDVAVVECTQWLQVHR